MSAVIEAHINLVDSIIVSQSEQPCDPIGAIPIAGLSVQTEPTRISCNSTDKLRLVYDTSQLVQYRYFYLIPPASRFVTRCDYIYILLFFDHFVYFYFCFPFSCAAIVCSCSNATDAFCLLSIHLIRNTPQMSIRFVIYFILLIEYDFPN